VKVGEEDYRQRIALRIYTAYQRVLRTSNAVDFGDLLLLLVDLLRRNADVRRKYQTRFEHVLVDEFQDTNPVQYELLKLVSPPPKGNLCVVGDDDQSVYRWRGAEVDNILNFPDQYAGARIVKLEQNYRSDQIILEAAHSVISRNRRRMQKKLWSDRARGEQLSLLIARDERGEAQEIIRRISALLREGLVRASDIAVFYRTHAQSRVLEEAFRIERIPYALVNARSFYDRAEVKDAASYLRLMINPRSDADLLRVINTPARGIGDTTVDRLTEFAARAEVSLYEALGKADGIATLNAAATRRLASFRELIDALAEYGRTAQDAASAVDRMLRDSNMLAAYQAEGTHEALGRAENLKELRGAAEEFDIERSARPPPSTEQLAPERTALEEFLERISLVGDADTEVASGRVAMMTLHAAKGLEFDVVFLAGMEDGVFPHQRALDENADPEEMDEERRLCYVGFTRARKRLFLSFAQARALFGELKFNPPSRFIREVPEELFDFANQERLDRAAPPPQFVPPRRRPMREDDETGPRIDRSFDQSVHYEDVDRPIIGLKVRHRQFGDGEVMAVDGTGPNAKLTVKFGSVGLKRVVARFLEPV
jgi:DNA helicase II / ATP-dependent DNA helicase PcrA